MKTKTETKHTPGPWFVEPLAGQEEGQFLVLGNRRGNFKSPIGVFGEPDARLIAAAPDLLEAAKLALRLLDIATIRNADTGEVREAREGLTAQTLRAAIAKAEGR